MFKTYWTSAWRTLVRNRLYTLINVLGLSLGICACLCIWMVVHYEFSFDRNHPDGKRIYRVVSYERYMKDEPEHLNPVVLAGLPAAMRTGVPGLQTVADYHVLDRDTALVTDAGKPARYPVRSVVAGPEYLRIMGYTWLAGDPQSALARPFSVVLTESRARRYFGMSPLNTAIGRQIVYQDSLRVNVSGIVSDWRENTDFPYTDFISFSTIDHSFLLQSLRLDPAQRYKFPPEASVLLKLSPNVHPDKLQAGLTTLFKNQKPPAYITHIGLQPLSEVHFAISGEETGDQTSQRSILYALMSIALFILALAIINYVNLSTAQSITREKEIGIRKVMGSGRGKLIMQLLAETFLLTLIAGLLALVAVRPVLGFFREYLPAEVRFTTFRPATLVFLAGITVAVTLMAGLYPARMLSAHAPASSLKGTGGVPGRGKWWLRKSLIVFQFSVSLLFIIGTMVIGRQIRFMLHQNLGFRSDAIILFSPDESRDSVSKLRVLQDEIRKLPGVDDVSLANNPPAGFDRGIFSVRYRPRSNDPVLVETIKADDRYIPLYGIQLLAGRNLSRSDTLKEVVINENLSKTLGFRTPEEAVGKEIFAWNRYLPIVGVVADFHKYSYREPIRPLMIVGMACFDFAVRLNTKGQSAAEAHAIIARIERQFKSFYPHQPFEYGFFDDEIAKFYKQEQTTEWLLNIAAGVTLFISCIGLFGLTLFTTQRRTKEIGIRKVMGADVIDILFLLGKDFIALVMIALLIASAGGWYLMHRWLRDYAYRISIGADVFLLAGAALLALTVFTVSFQSLKAAMVSPVKSLRSE